MAWFRKSFKKPVFIYVALFTLITPPLILLTTPVLNPDGIEYIAIAKHYAAFDFSAAINGIWSPLLSWFFLIPLLSNIDPSLFFRLLMTAVSVGVILLFNRLFIQITAHFPNKPVNHPYYQACLVFIFAFCVYATFFTPITPDLLSVMFVLLIFTFAIRYYDSSRLRDAALIGLFSGLGYYAKSYVLYFSLICLSLFFGALFIRKKGAAHLKAWSVSLLVCGAIISPWIILMSYKYDRVTINPIGDYALSQVGPNYPGPPVMTLGLLDPPYENSITAREDPTSFNYVAWSPFGSKQDLKYYLLTILPHNILSGIGVLAPVLIILGLSLFSLIHENRRKVSTLWSFRFISLIVASTIYVGGYCLVHIEGGLRYLWPAYILLALAFYLIIPQLNKKIRPFMLIIGTLAISLYPIQASIPSTLRAVSDSREARQLAKTLGETSVIQKGANIASNDPYRAANMCYLLSLRCYGLPKKSIINQQLAEKKIQYIFNFDNRKSLKVDGELIFDNKELQIIQLKD